MASRFRRTPFVRLAVGAAALAIPLFAAGSALAAMGGAIPQTSGTRPDLRTVTLVTANTAQFCFDKNLSQAPALVPGNFVLGGYKSTDATQSITAAYDLTNTSCVDAVFPPTVATRTVDYNQYSFGSVGSGAVKALSGANVNDADSTALTGSTTNNGTTGNTIAPDLTGVVPNPSFLTMNFVYNKNIGNTPVAGRFNLVDPGGNLCPGTGVTVSGNTVSVTFPAVCPPPFAAGNPIQNAVRTHVLSNTVANVATTPTYVSHLNADFQTAIVPGTSGTTARPDLVSAALTPDGTAIDFNFDQPIALAIPGLFAADLANNTNLVGSGTPIITNTATTGTVRVTFANGGLVNEYDVKATVAAFGVEALNTLTPGIGGSVPVGDNAGAFARGFSTGGDAVAVTFNNATGAAVITFDQRIAPGSAVPGGFHLLDANGSPIVAGGAASVQIVPAAAGPLQVTANFAPTAMALAKAIEICGPPSNIGGGFGPPSAADCTAASLTGSVFTSSGAVVGSPEPNVQQILSPFAVSAKLIKRVTVWAPKSAHVKKQHAKKHVKHTRVRKHRNHKR